MSQQRPNQPYRTSEQSYSGETVPLRYQGKYASKIIIGIPFWVSATNLFPRNAVLVPW